MKRSAFTLIELLVIIAIIALLSTLLFAAVNVAREAARRAQCLTHQRDIAIALQIYDKANNGLPGYLNQLGGTPVHSWAVAIFPHIGENKRYEAIINGTPFPLATPGALLCPSDNPREDTRMNYVVNCGPVEETGIDGDNAPATTLFKDRRTALTALYLNKKVQIAEIPNGASNTIVLSENLSENPEVGYWYRDDWALNWTTPTTWVSELPTVTIDPSGTPTRDRYAVDNLGFIWSLAKNRDFAPNSPVAGPRPASRHPGTFVVAYADGSAKPVNANIGILEYLKAVCVDTEAAGL